MSDSPDRTRNRVMLIVLSTLTRFLQRNLGYCREDFVRNDKGAIAVLAAVALPVMLLIVGVAIDYGSIHKQRTFLQFVADAAALAGAKELSLTDANRESISGAVGSVVKNLISGNTEKHRNTNYDVAVDVRSDTLEVDVQLRQAAITPFGLAKKFLLPHLKVKSVAKVVGQPNVCLLALEPSAPMALKLATGARMTGNDCSIFSNSLSAHGIAVGRTAVLKARNVCSSGGADNLGEVSPSVMVDCPQFADPLASRIQPTISACDYRDVVIVDKTVTLQPGTYCGGLHVGGTANVRFADGIYAIDAGPFVVADQAKIEGTSVSFFLGPTTALEFAPNTAIVLEAMKTGALAGIVIFGSRNQSTSVEHKIKSRNAQKLTGTIYLPGASLMLDGDANVGGLAAYTAIVARKVMLQNGPNLVLNSNYSQTDVPVPEGIKGVGQPIQLVQ